MAIYTKTNADSLAGTSADDIFLVELPANAVNIGGGDGFDELRLTATAGIPDEGGRPVNPIYFLNADTQNIERVVLGTGEGEAADTSWTVDSSVQAALVGNGLEIIGNAGSNGLTGTAFDDSLFGGAGLDALQGGEGNDTLDGGIGTDELTGGLGDDVYYVHLLEWNAGARDTFTDTLDGGSDTLIYDWTGIAFGSTPELPAHIENAVLQGVTSTDVQQSVTGNSLDNNISIADTDAVATIVLIGNGGNDTLTGSGTRDALLGGTGDDSLAGGVGADILQGGEGADTMVGGAGDDLYANFDADEDTIVEEVNGGTDRINVGDVEDFTLLENIENLIMSSAGHVVGNAANNRIEVNRVSLVEGLAGHDVLLSFSGDGTLIGGLGKDTMGGGFGNNLYGVDNVADQVLERVSEGADTVQASVDYLLADNVEDLALVGNEDIDGKGNSQANHLTGNSGSNVLDGGAGLDLLEGGLGDDFFIATRGDTIVEAASAGIDTVVVSGNWTLGANLEDLVLSGFGNYSGTGNVAANQILGNSGRNLINGVGGNDQLFGDYGADTLLGGGGNDDLSAEAGHDSLDGGSGNDALDGGGGNDTLAGGVGIDVLAGGAGNDVLVWDAADAVADEAISGGNGKDTLRLAGGSLNLLLIGQDAIQGIEAIDLRVATANTLKLNAQDLLDLSNTSNVLQVDGTSADKVNISGGGWADGGTRTIGVELYHVYRLGAATLVVDADIATTITLGP
jgi:trimeric autotransporter adhesin